MKSAEIGLGHLMAGSESHKGSSVREGAIISNGKRLLHSGPGLSTNIKWQKKEMEKGVTRGNIYALRDGIRQGSMRLDAFSAKGDG